MSKKQRARRHQQVHTDQNLRYKRFLLNQTIANGTVDNPVFSPDLRTLDELSQLSIFDLFSVNSGTRATVRPEGHSLPLKRLVRSGVVAAGLLGLVLFQPVKNASATFAHDAYSPKTRQKGTNVLVLHEPPFQEKEPSRAEHLLKPIQTVVPTVLTDRKISDKGPENGPENGEGGSLNSNELQTFLEHMGYSNIHAIVVDFDTISPLNNISQKDIEHNFREAVDPKAVQNFVAMLHQMEMTRELQAISQEDADKVSAMLIEIVDKRTLDESSIMQIQKKYPEIADYLHNLFEDVRDQSKDNRDILVMASKLKLYLRSKGQEKEKKIKTILELAQAPYEWYATTKNSQSPALTAMKLAIFTLYPNPSVIAGGDVSYLWENANYFFIGVHQVDATACQKIIGCQFCAGLKPGLIIVNKHHEFTTEAHINGQEPLAILISSDSSSSAGTYSIDGLIYNPQTKKYEEVILTGSDSGKVLRAWLLTIYYFNNSDKQSDTREIAQAYLFKHLDYIAPNTQFFVEDSGDIHKRFLPHLKQILGQILGTLGGKAGASQLQSNIDLTDAIRRLIRRGHFSIPTPK